MATLWIPGQLPGLQQLLDANTVRSKRGKNGKHWTKYSAIKKSFGAKVALCARAIGFPPVPDTGAIFTYEFIEPDRRRDPSNVIAGGIKIVEDALRFSGLLKNDGWRHVRGIVPLFRVVGPGEAPGVRVTVTPLAQPEKGFTLGKDSKDVERGPADPKTPARDAPRASRVRRPRRTGAGRARRTPANGARS